MPHEKPQGPAASPVKLERLQQLEVALMVKNREVQELQKRVTELWQCRADTSTFVYKLLENKSLLFDVPMEHLSNVLTKVRSEHDREVRESKAMEKEIADVNLKIESETHTQQGLAKEVDFMRDLTGGIEADVHPEDQKRAIEQLRIRIRVLEKELRTAVTIRQKKDRTVKEMQQTIERKHAEVEERLGMQNTLRVMDRTVRERKEELTALLTKHSQLDRELKRLTAAKDQTTLALLGRDNHLLTERMGDVVEQRRTQDRVVKAQEYRIKRLQARLATVELALERSGLKKDVESRVAEVVAAAGNQLVKLPDDPKDLYIIDNIAPVQEKVHPALYALLSACRASLEKHQGMQQVMIGEKQEVLLALEAKATDMREDYNRAEQELFEATQAVGEKLEEEKVRLGDEMIKRREQYNAAIREKNEMKRKANRDHASPENPQWHLHDRSPSKTKATDKRSPAKEKKSPSKEAAKPAEQPKEATKPAEQPKEAAKPADQPKEEVKPAEQPKEAAKPAEQPKEAAKPAEQPKEEVK